MSKFHKVSESQLSARVLNELHSFTLSDAQSHAQLSSRLSLLCAHEEQGEWLKVKQSQFELDFFKLTKDLDDRLVKLSKVFILL